jgi:hypothetical protein
MQLAEHRRGAGHLRLAGITGTTGALAPMQEKAVFLQPAVEQFIIANLDGLHGTRKRTRHVDSENLQDTLKDARNYMNEHEINWDKSENKSNRSWDMVVLLKASASDLSKISIQFPSDRLEIYPKLSDWAK